VQMGLDEAAKDALVLLHDQLGQLYDGSKCRGGQPWLGAEAKPSNFSQVECHDEAASAALSSLLQNASLDEGTKYASYENCTADPAFKRGSKQFTQAFCASEARIVSLAGRYGHYLVWVPVPLVVLSFIVFVATFCRIHNQKMKRPESFRCPYLRENAQAFYCNTRTIQIQTEPTEPLEYSIGTPPQSPRLQIFAHHRPLDEP